MPNDPSDRDPLEKLAEAFFERRRANEALTVEAFVEEHGEPAEPLAKLLPMLLQLEDAAQDHVGRTAPLGVAPGRSLGQYKLIREVGRGGMGVVFEGYDEQLERRVAIKVLPSQASLDTRLLERFEREASSAARLTHPNIVSVYGVGESEGLHYFAMEFVDGATLDSICDQTSGADGDGTASSVGSRSARDHFRRAARLALEAAHALDHAHGHGVIHRDIKPSNLILTKGGKLKIADFGLCHADGAAHLTQTHDMLGTLRYVAPEQFKGDTDARSDICSLGLVLYELLTLQPARPATDRLGLARQVAEGRIVPPRKIDRRIPRDLETIVLKATEADPNLRYANAAAMARDLDAWLGDRAIRARRPSFGYLLGLAARRNRGAAAAWLALVLACIIGTLVFSASQRRWAMSERQQREIAENREYAASIAAAQGAVEAGWTDAARQHLAGCDPARRGWEWTHLGMALDRSSRRISAFEQGTLDAALDPTQRTLAVSDDRGTVKTMTWPSCEVLASLKHPAGVERVRFLDARRLLTCCRDGHLRIWDLESGTIAIEVTAHTKALTGMALHVPTDTLVTTSYDRSVGVWDVDTLTLRYRRKIGTSTWPPAIHPSGACVAFGALDNRIRVLRLSDGAQIADLDFMADQMKRTFYRTPVAFSPDGSQLACPDRRGRIHLLDGRTFAPHKVLLGWNDHPWRLAFLGNDRLVVAREGGHLRTWDIKNERVEADLPGHDFGVYGLTVVDEGATLLTCGNADLLVWELPLEPIPLVLRGTYNYAAKAACAIDADRLAIGGRRGLIVVWNVTTGRIETELRCDNYVASLGASPDGETLVAGMGDGEIVAWHLATKQRLWTVKPRKGLIPDTHFSKDGRQILVAARDHSVLLLDSSNGRVVREFECLGRHPTTARFLHGEQRVLIASLEGVVECRSVSAGNPLWIRKTGWGRIYADVSRDGEKVACADVHGVLHLLDGESGKTVKALHGHTSGLHWPAFTPDGSRVISASKDGSLKLWDVATGKELLNLREHAVWLFRTAIAPDASWIAVTASEGDVRVYRRGK